MGTNGKGKVEIPQDVLAKILASIGADASGYSLSDITAGLKKVAVSEDSEARKEERRKESAEVLRIITAAVSAIGGLKDSHRATLVFGPDGALTINVRPEKAEGTGGPRGETQSMAPATSALLKESQRLFFDFHKSLGVTLGLREISASDEHPEVKYSITGILVDGVKSPVNVRAGFTDEGRFASLVGENAAAGFAKICKRLNGSLPVYKTGEENNVEATVREIHGWL